MVLRRCPSLAAQGGSSLCLSMPMSESAGVPGWSSKPPAQSGNALWDGFASLFHKIRTAHDLPKVQERTFFPEECYDMTDVSSHWSDSRLKELEDAMIVFVKELQNGTRIKFREETAKVAEAIYMSRPSYFMVKIP